MNNRGQLQIIFIMFLVLFLTGVFSVDTTRKALADDIKSGKLRLNPKSSVLISKGDNLLNSTYDICVRRKEITGETYCNENDLYTAFVAKVFFERARLEMEDKE